MLSVPHSSVFCLPLCFFFLDRLTRTGMYIHSFCSSIHSLLCMRKLSVPMDQNAHSLCMRPVVGKQALKHAHTATRKHALSQRDGCPTQQLFSTSEEVPFVVGQPDSPSHHKAKGRARTQLDGRFGWVSIGWSGRGVLPLFTVFSDAAHATGWSERLLANSGCCALDKYTTTQLVQLIMTHVNTIPLQWPVR